MTELILTTPHQLRQIINDCLNERPVQKLPEKNQKPIKGIHALAEFLGISPVTAQSLKNSGKIPYSQFGRIILFDGENVIKTLSGNNQPKKK